MKLTNQHKAKTTIRHKIQTAIETIKLFQNWPKIILGQFGFISKEGLVYKLRNGFKFKVSSDNDYSPFIDVWLKKVYIPSDDYLKECYIVVDIGAHVGAFSVFAATHNKGIRVLSYEPHPENFAILQANIKLNQISNVSAFQLAIADERGKFKLFVSPFSLAHSLINSKEDDTAIDIQCITLEDVLKNISQCDLLKLDCEGAEYGIFFSTTEQLLRKVKFITAEVHETVEFLGRGYSIEGLKVNLENKGFTVKYTIYLQGIPPGSTYAYLYAKNNLFMPGG